jgi:RNA 2',3'-cyclic 3'-phosphodiesterase
VRLFVAIDIAEDVRSRIQRFIEGVSGFAPDARWVSPESLHLTLKFIGEKTEASAENIKQALSTIKSEPLEIAFRNHGFFPGPKHARVFWIGVDADPQLPALAVAIDNALAPLNIPKETHAFFPHITLARAAPSRASKSEQGGGLPHGFGRLQEKLSALSSPEFGSMTAREFFLYESQLSGKGPRYIKLASFELA